MRTHNRPSSGTAEKYTVGPFFTGVLTLQRFPAQGLCKVLDDTTSSNYSGLAWGEPLLQYVPPVQKRGLARLLPQLSSRGGGNGWDDGACTKSSGRQRVETR